MQTRRNPLKVILWAAVFVFSGWAQAEAALVYQTVGFPEHYNARLQNWDAGYPEGDNLVLGGIPFKIPPGVNNTW